MLYDGCPKSLKAGVWWPQTKFGFSAVVLCPKGSLGESGVPWGWENLAVVQELPAPARSPQAVSVPFSWSGGLGGGKWRRKHQAEGEQRGLVQGWEPL